MNRRGFTLVEVLMATFIVAVTVVGVMGAIQSVTMAELKAKEAELLQRLAMVKMNEVIAAGDPDTIGYSGTYSTEGYSDISWTLTSTASGTDNVDLVTVEAKDGNESQSIQSLIYVSTNTTTSASSPTTTPSRTNAGQ